MWATSQVATDNSWCTVQIQFQSLARSPKQKHIQLLNVYRLNIARCTLTFESTTKLYLVFPLKFKLCYKTLECYINVALLLLILFYSPKLMSGWLLANISKKQRCYKITDWLSYGFTSHPTQNRSFWIFLPSQFLGLVLKNWNNHNKSKHASTTKYTTTYSCIINPKN